jgi:hypothetical protein
MFLIILFACFVFLIFNYIHTCIEGFTKINIVINTYINNTAALNHLLDSLKKCTNFASCNVYVFIGGYYSIDGYEKTIEDNITYIKCNHNSIDFTGLIGVLEFLPKVDEYYFYLHDTCVVGPNFINNVTDIDLNQATSLRLKEFPSMNIGVYSNNIIHENKDILITLKNTDENRTQEFKMKGVEMEDMVFRNDKNNKLINNRDHYVKTEGPVDYYNTGVQRIIEHYDLDFLKIKANWHQKDTYELKV